MFDALKALDATVAMDDFGTGYSSLAYLQRLPIDVLKIDKSFVSGMMVDPDAVAIVRAVLSLAEALGMSTTAEGIETVELATTLATLGCASGPGLLFRQAARGGMRRSNTGSRAAAERIAQASAAVVTLRSISAFRSFEIGQFALASSASPRRSSSEIPGTLARSSRSERLTLKPGPSWSS